MPGDNARSSIARPPSIARPWVLLPGHALVALALTWPLARDLGGSLPLGTEPVETVPLFNLWTLRWNQHEAGELFRHFWDAPIFHPTPGTFALSEPQPLTALFFTPIAALTRNPVLAYNVTLLAIFVLNGYGGYRLARRFVRDDRSAVLAGVLAVGLPFALAQMGVLQLTALFPLFLLIEAVLAWSITAAGTSQPAGRGTSQPAGRGTSQPAGRGTSQPAGGGTSGPSRDGRRRGAAIGLWLAVTFLMCGYYGLFAIVVVGPAALALLRRSWFSRPRLVDLAVAVAVFAALALPVAGMQAHLTAGYERSDLTIEALSARREDFFELPATARGTAVEPWLRDDGTERHPLYPGTVLLVLAVIGFAVTHRRTARIEYSERERRRLAEKTTPDGNGTAAATAPCDATPTDAIGGAGNDGDPIDVGALTERRHALNFVLIGAALAAVLAFGLHLDIGGWQPYQLVRTVVPGFKSLRSPFRFGALSQVFLVPLAALGLELIGGFVNRIGRPAVATIALGGLVVLALAEVDIAPVPLHTVDQDRPDWATWLSDQPAAPDASSGAVAVVPFPADGRVGSYAETTRAMLALIDGDHPLVNGYSGLFPPTYDELEAAMRAGFPSDRTTAMLQADGVTYVVVIRTWVRLEPEDVLDPAIGYTRVFQGSDADVYQLSQ